MFQKIYALSRGIQNLLHK